MAFYSLLFYAISVDASGHWDLYKTIHYLLPVRYSIYWFVTAYIGTYLLSPYLARLAQNLNKREYTSFICILTGMFVLYSFLKPEADPFKIDGGYTVLWFITLFYWGGYIRLSDIKASGFLQKRPFLIYFNACVITFLSKKPMHYFFQYLGVPVKARSFYGFYMYNSPTILLASIALFIFFLNLKINSDKIKNLIQYIAPSTFGVYLIHEHPFIRSQLWNHWIHVKSLASSPYFILHFIITILGIFAICIMGPLSRPRSKILRVAVSRIILSSEASKVKLVGNLVA